jgi:hypothetical protein
MAVSNLTSNTLKGGWSTGALPISTNRNLDARDNGVILSASVSNNISLTLTTDADGKWVDGSRFIISQDGTGVIEVLAASGVSITNANATIAQWEPMQFRRTAANTWIAYNGSGGFTGRALFAGGSQPTVDVVSIEYFSIATQGTPQVFGNLTSSARQFVSSFASSTRAIWTTATSPGNVIDYVTIATLGNAATFGTLTQARGYASGTSNDTRGLTLGGYTTVSVATIDYVTIATTGNATSFGSLSSARYGTGSASNSTRSICAIGTANVIDYVTISTTGNAISFGTSSGSRNYIAACSNAIRMIIGGGESALTSAIEYLTMSTLGNTTSFGSLIIARSRLAAASSAVSGIFIGGYNNVSYVTTMDYVNINTTGNAVTFSSLGIARGAHSGCSNSHGGL